MICVLTCLKRVWKKNGEKSSDLDHSLMDSEQRERLRYRKKKRRQTPEFGFGKERKSVGKKGNNGNKGKNGGNGRNGSNRGSGWMSKSETPAGLEKLKKGAKGKEKEKKEEDMVRSSIGGWESEEQSYEKLEQVGLSVSQVGVDNRLGLEYSYEGKNSQGKKLQGKNSQGKNELEEVEERDRREEGNERSRKQSEYSRGTGTEYMSVREGDTEYFDMDKSMMSRGTGAGKSEMFQSFHEDGGIGEHGDDIWADFED